MELSTALNPELMFQLTVVSLIMIIDTIFFC